MLRAKFKLPLRQAEGLPISFIELPGFEMTVSNRTTVSRRAIESALQIPQETDLQRAPLGGSGGPVYTRTSGFMQAAGDCRTDYQAAVERQGSAERRCRDAPLRASLIFLQCVRRLRSTGHVLGTNL